MTKEILLDVIKKREIILPDKKRLALLKRKENLRRKTGMALTVLRPLVNELALYGEEMKETTSFNVELQSKIDQKNPFVIDGDYNESVVRAMNFLLQEHTLSQIAKALIPDHPDFKDQVVESRTQLISLMKEKNPTRFGRK